MRCVCSQISVLIIGGTFCCGAPDGLLVQAAGIDYRLRVSITTQHHQQIGDHGGLPFFIQIENIVFRQAIERHADHADGSVNDPGAGRDHGLRLLPLQHGSCDFGRVRQMTDARLEYLYTGFIQTLLDVVCQLFANIVRIATQ